MGNYSEGARKINSGDLKGISYPDSFSMQTDGGRDFSLNHSAGRDFSLNIQPPSIFF
jgi:hypothetical protein